MMQSSRSSLILLGVAIMLGLWGAGFLVGDALKTMKRADRYVTVKGLAEREVKADLATWPIRFKVAGNDLLATQADLEATQKKVVDFLKTQGFKNEELGFKALRVIDRQAREYSESKAGDLRYIMESTVMVRTGNVELVNKVSQMVSDLVKAGVVLAEENACDMGPRYAFTQFNELKQEMLAEATKKARSAAQQFANDSGSAVGAIRQAYQGTFSISSRDSSADTGDYNNGCNDSAIEKKVRVVSTVDYYLER